MKRLLVMLLMLLMPAFVVAQAPLLYNPTRIVFDQTATEFANTSSYLLDFYAPAGTTPLFTADVTKTLVSTLTDATGTHYVIPLLGLSIVPPSAQTYVVKVRAVNATGTSDPSNVSLEQARFSTCVNATGSIVQMSMNVSTTLRWGNGTYAPVVMTLNSAAPVHYVSINFLGSGSPAIQFYSPVDLRGQKSYMLGKMPRVGTFPFVVTAIDEQSCSVTAALGSATIF